MLRQLQSVGCVLLVALVVGVVADVLDATYDVEGVTACDPRLLASVGCPAEEHGVDWEAFLRAACAACPEKQPCRPDRDGGGGLLVQIAIQATRVDPEKSFVCMRGVLAAIIVIAQFYLMDAPEGLQRVLSIPRSLRPFPFHTTQYSLYTNMVSAHLTLCDQHLERAAGGELVANKFVPRVHHQDSGICGVTVDDAQLVRRCRSRRKTKVDRLALGARLSDHVIAPVRCPDDDIDLGADLSQKLRKYSERADMLQCQSRQGMWRQEMNDMHKCVLISVGQLMDFRPGQLVLDWGSGCGHKLSWAKMFFDVDGLGVELVDSAVAWAKEHSLGHFCQADGRNLSWVPDGVFDHVFSYAAIYHLPNDEQCSVGIQLVQKLRIGGKAFIGWNQRAMDNLEWVRCFQSTPLVEVDLEAVEDAFIFPATAKAASDHYLFHYPSYSLFLTRLA
eukprot:TRINITY_DN58414_c0_g1_i2.p1 TRINITY_DN58414_c0_g1~~TRINITY_DN58414_c0_g1_i2.p1  ORF type:complete len:446 (+),score=78.68 TRINITY_DN58414_c0_g1_i2:102-1439(+)